MSTLTSAEPIPAIMIPSALPDAVPRRADVAMQIAHRAAIVSIFAFLGVLGLMYKGNQITGVTWAVGAMFICADLGCCAAFFGRTLLRRSKLRREATTVLLVNATLVILSLQLMLLTRLDLIRSVCKTFFKPD